MCTGIVETAKISGTGRGTRGWFDLESVSVSYDHPFQLPLEHALNIDFVDNTGGLSGNRLAVELTPESAKRLAQSIIEALARGDAK
jgi:hypothetical protein